MVFNIMVKKQDKNPTPKQTGVKSVMVPTVGPHSTPATNGGKRMLEVSASSDGQRKQSSGVKNTKPARLMNQAGVNKSSSSSQKGGTRNAWKVKTLEEQRVMAEEKEAGKADAEFESLADQKEEAPTNPPTNPGGDQDASLIKEMPLEAEEAEDDAPTITFSDEVNPIDRSPEMQKFHNFAVSFFYKSGYSLKSLKEAQCKVNYWAQATELVKKDDNWARAAHRELVGVWKDRVKPTSMIDRLKSVVLTYCEDLLEQNLPRLLILGGVVGLGLLSWVIRKPKFTLPMMAVGLGCLPWVRKRDPRVTYCKYAADFCTKYEKPHEKLLETATLDCKMKQFPVGITFAKQHIWIPRLCTHNERCAIVERQLIDYPVTEVGKQYWKEAEEQLAIELPPVEVPTNVNAVEMFLKKFPAGKQGIIRKALVDNGDLAKIDSLSRVFVKREWSVGKALHKRHPRLISGMSDSYLAATGPEYYVWQKEMCKHMREKEFELHYIYTGGMTAEEIGALVSKFEFMGYLALEGDYKRYDAHNSTEALRAEMGYYSRVSFSPETLDWLKKQLLYNARSTFGFRFKRKASRGSGVINTSLGNTILGFMIAAKVAKILGITDWFIIQLGDDNIFLWRHESVTSEDVDRVFRDVAHQMGHELESVIRERNYDSLEYCSSLFWPVETPEGPSRVLVPKIGRILAKTFMPHDDRLEEALVPSYLAQVAEGFSGCAFVPVLGEFCAAVMRDNKNCVKRDLVGLHEYKLLPKQKFNRTNEHYDFFYRRYGFEAKELFEFINTTKWAPGTVVDHELVNIIMEIDGVAVDAPNAEWLN